MREYHRPQFVPAITTILRYPASTSTEAGLLFCREMPTFVLAADSAANLHLNNKPKRDKKKHESVCKFVCNFYNSLILRVICGPSRT